MNTIVKIKYQEIPHSLEITCNEKVFDTSNINQMKIEDIAYPFILNGVKWMGLYEELKKFTGENQFTIQFEGDDKSFGILKNALQNFPVKLATTNNKVIILYNENPFNTKITVNGAIFDTSRIQNRSIEEWVKPIHIRGLDWNGIYQELSDFIGIDVFSIEFVGSQEFMNVLIEDCPQTVSVMFRNPANNFNQNTNYNSNPNNTQGFSDILGKAVNQVKQNVSDEKTEKNLQQTSIKKEFVLKNINTIIVVVYLLSLFLPFCTVLSSEIGYINDFDITGFDALLGCEFTDGTSISGGFWGFMMIAFPILLIVINYVKALQKFKKPALLVCPIGALICQNAAEITVANALNVDAIRATGYYVSLIALIILLVVCFMQFKNVPISKDGLKQLKEKF